MKRGAFAAATVCLWLALGPGRAAAAGEDAFLAREATAVAELEAAPDLDRARREGVLAVMTELARTSPEFASAVSSILLEDSRPRVRAAALEVLSRAGAESFLDRLERRLFGDPELEIRGRAARALLAFGSPRLIGSLLGLEVSLSDGEARAIRERPEFPRVERDLLACLGENGPAADEREAAERELAEEYQYELDIMEREDLRAGRRKPRPESFRREIVMLLGAVRSEAAAPVLVRLLDDKDEPTAVAAATALGLIRSGGALAALRKALADPRPAVADAALRGLASAGAEVPAAECVRLLGSVDAALRRGAARELGLCAEAPEAPPALAGALGDPDALVRREAILSLGVRGGSAEAPALGRLYALAATGEEALAAQAVIAIAARVAAEPPEVRRTAEAREALALASVVGPGATEEAVRAATSDAGGCVRAAALRRLAELSGRGGSDRLVAALGDGDATVRRSAAEALGRALPAGSAAEARDSSRARQGSLASAALLAAAASTDEKLAVACCDALGGIAQPELAAGCAARLAAEERPAVRDALARALRRLTGADFGPDERRWERYLRASAALRPERLPSTADKD